jgi:hypothetical protein
LGGFLIADEFIEVFLPVLYFAVQKRRWAKTRRVSFWNGAISVERRLQSIESHSVASSAPQDGPGVT